MCPHIVDGRARSAAGWAGGRQSAARLWARSCGAHVWKKLRERRAGLLGEEGKAQQTQKKLIVILRTCAGLSRSGHESHRAFARCRHSGTISGSTAGTGSSPHRKTPVTRCVRLSLHPGHPFGSVA
ncbi:hypothetical protein TcG_11816 [Trypanosoma cruzi]|nr:hypothetical protein TcG_11816 [Trypanosoma cruzi]